MKCTRRYDRNLCADLLKIRWTDAAGRKRREIASLEDISPAGACLQLEEPIPLNTALSLIHPRGMYRCTVKYCSFQTTGYFIGVEFAPGTRWRARDFDPAHLLRLRFRIPAEK